MIPPRPKDLPDGYESALMILARRPAVINEELAAELENYLGRWVTIIDGHVAASADTLGSLIMDNDLDDNLVMRVPKHPDRPFFGAGSVAETLDALREQGS